MVEATTTIDCNENSLVKMRDTSHKESRRDREIGGSTLNQSNNYAPPQDLYSLQKPISLGQPNLSQSRVLVESQPPEMLKLITNTAMHLKHEAERVTQSELASSSAISVTPASV